MTRLARGDGKGALRNLGISRSELLQDARSGVGSIYQNFRARGQGDAVRGVVDELMERLLREQLRLGDDAARRYVEQAEVLADGAGRATLARAILEEERHYGAVADADDLSRARERAYYLAVALSDASTDNARGAIGPGDDTLVPDRRFRRHVMEIHTRHRQRILDVYGRLLATTNREPVHDVERIELVIRTLLEGAMLLRRVVAGHRSLADQPPEDRALGLQGEALVDAVLNVFVAMSHPAGIPKPDPGVVLFGRGRARTPNGTSEVMVYRDRRFMYRTIQETIAQLSNEETLSHCALHTSHASAPRTQEGAAFRATVDRFVFGGGHLRNLEQIRSLAELDATVDRLRDDVAAGRRVTWRVMLMDSPPAMSPFLIGDRVALLGREEDGLIIDGVAFADEAGRRWCKNHFDALWRDDRGYTLATPRGLEDRGISDARLRLEAIERRRPGSVV